MRVSNASQTFLLDQILLIRNRGHTPSIRTALLAHIRIPSNPQLLQRRNQTRIDKPHTRLRRLVNHLIPYPPRLTIVFQLRSIAAVGSPDIPLRRRRLTATRCIALRVHFCVYCRCHIVGIMLAPLHAPQGDELHKRLVSPAIHHADPDGGEHEWEEQ